MNVRVGPYRGLNAEECFLRAQMSFAVIWVVIRQACGHHEIVMIF